MYFYPLQLLFIYISTYPSSAKLIDIQIMHLVALVDAADADGLPPLKSKSSPSFCLYPEYPSAKPSEYFTSLFVPDGPDGGR